MRYPSALNELQQQCSFDAYLQKELHLAVVFLLCMINHTTKATLGYPRVSSYPPPTILLYPTQPGLETANSSYSPSFVHRLRQTPSRGLRGPRYERHPTYLLVLMSTCMCQSGSPMYAPHARGSKIQHLLGLCSLFPTLKWERMARELESRKFLNWTVFARFSSTTLVKTQK